MKIRLPMIDATSERWRYDVRLFILAYLFGLFAFSAIIT